MRIGSAKSADNFAIRAEFAVAESCMILKLCMIGLRRRLHAAIVRGHIEASGDEDDV